MFKTSVRGFKKSDVNNYIIELNKDFSEIKLNYETEITELKLKLNKAENDLEIARHNEDLLNAALSEVEKLKLSEEQLSADLASAKSECSLLAEKNNELCEKISSNEAKNDELANELKTKESEAENLLKNINEYKETIDTQASKITLLESQLSESGNMLSEVKAELESISSNKKDLETEVKNLAVRNGELEGLLKQTAHKIAAYESERISNEERRFITQKAKKADENLTKAAARATFDIKNSVIENAESCLKEFQQFADKVQFTSKSAISELADEYSIMASRAAYFCDILDQSTRRSVDDFKENTKVIFNNLDETN